MASFAIATGGQISGEVTAIIEAAAVNATITTGESTGVVAIPAGALWVEIANAGAVQAGDLPNNATIQGGSWSPGRKERWVAEWNVNLGEYNYLPGISINGNGARVFYTYMA